MQMNSPYHVFRTAAGYCGIGWNDAAISRFQLAGATFESTESQMRRKLPGADPREPQGPVRLAVTTAQTYFDGANVDFSAFELDVTDQPDFFRQVYAELRTVPWGKTTTYGAIARTLGAGPEAARAVGQAMAKNPIPLLIPCHRVLAAGGRLGGFSAPGGSTSKARMLELEGAVPADAEPAQFGLPF